MAGPSLQGLINRDVLEWARRSAQLSEEDAARKLQIKPERLREWELGTRVPTLTQLRNLADVYKRSLGVFFLDAVPLQSKKPPDFRRIELRSQGSMSRTLATAFREAEEKRDTALDILAQLEDEPRPFTLGFDGDPSVEAAANALSKGLGAARFERRKWPDEYRALNEWKRATEDQGVLVLQISGVDLGEMRAAAIAQFPLPVILLNGADSPLGRIFSLLHELVHLARAESALCDEVDESGDGIEAKVETYCNAVAGSVLLPADLLMQHPLIRQATSETLWTGTQLWSLRRDFWASREAILRRLLTLNRTTAAHYRAMRSKFESEARSHSSRQPDKIIIPPARRVLMKNGRMLTKLALDAYNSGAITGTTLSRALGTKLDHVPQISAMLHQGLSA